MPLSNCMHVPFHSSIKTPLLRFSFKLNYVLVYPQGIWGVTEGVVSKHLSKQAIYEVKEKKLQLLQKVVSHCRLEIPSSVAMLV